MNTKDGLISSVFGAEESEAIALYDAFAPGYDEAFAEPSLRSLYDGLAWELVRQHLPPVPATVVDVGCGTGRWARRLIEKGYTVIGIEPSPRMRDVLQSNLSSGALTVVATDIEHAELPPGSAGAVLAMGSLQYVADPSAALTRMTGWLRPDGFLCVHVDGLVALVLELIRLGRRNEALQRLTDGRGIFSYGSKKAPLHLFDRLRLTSLLETAGLMRVETRGILVTPSAFGRPACEVALAHDLPGLTSLERALSNSPIMTDAGKHIMAWGWRR